MQVNPTQQISLLFEVSWEVCNKIGGIYTVLSTKAQELKKQYSDRLIFIGPDVWTAETPSPYFVEKKTILKKASSSLSLPFDIKIRTGRWNIPGSPQVVLVDFKGVYSHLDEIYGQMWHDFGVDSLHAYGDYAEGCAFAVASAIVVKAISEHLLNSPEGVVAHFDEWTTGMGLLYLKTIMPDAATIFTTHATSIGRSICGNGKPLYQYFNNYNGDQMARELNMESKHSLEKAAAKYADCFTTVSEVTARECEQLLEVKPQVVTPNGFEPSFVPESRKAGAMRRVGRKKLLTVASRLVGKEFPSDTFIVATSGRNEYRNKGLDLFLDSMEFLGEYNHDDERPVLACVLVPAWVKEPNGALLIDLIDEGTEKVEPNYLTHRLNNEDSDAVACHIRRLAEAAKQNNVSIIYIPCYLDGHDGIVDISYYDILPALDATVFASYYEPWGYTPLESIAFSVPTVTTDKAGFGQWVLSNFPNSLEQTGVEVIERTDTNYQESKQKIAGILREYYLAKPTKVKKARMAAAATAAKADWKYFISNYDEAFAIALKNNKNNLAK